MRISIRILEAAEPFFAMRSSPCAQQLAESLLEFLHQPALARAIVVIILGAVGILKYDGVDVHGFRGAVIVEKPADAQRNVERIALHGEGYEMLDEVNDHVLFSKLASVA